MIQELPERLRMIRTKRLLKQKVVAENVGIEPGTLSQYEKGTASPSALVLARLAVAYGVSMDYLMGLERERAMFIDGLDEDQICSLECVANQFRKSNQN